MEVINKIKKTATCFTLELAYPRVVQCRCRTFVQGYKLFVQGYKQFEISIAGILVLLEQHIQLKQTL